MDRRQLGHNGEALAARYLEERGWRILARNFRSGHKEVDLIARRDSVIVFVEVKARQSRRFGHPFEAITYRKRREVTAAARGWLCEVRPRGCSVRRFDAIAVLFQPDGTVDIEHVEDAWRAGE